MAGYDLKSLNKTASVHPPRLLVYGPPGLGKTTLASEFPNPVIIDIEQGTPTDVSVSSFGEIDSYDQALEAIKALYTDEHDFKTLIIDSIDGLEPLLWSSVARDNQWQSIEDAGFGKGYIEADAYWRKILAGCNALRAHRGMTIIYIAHSTVARFDDPTSEPYSRYEIRLHKRAKAIMEDEVDAILFLNRDLAIKSEDAGFNKKVARAESGGFTWINTQPNPAYDAKNRFNLPERIKFDKGTGYSQLKSFLPGHKPAAETKEKAAA